MPQTAEPATDTVTAAELVRHDDTERLQTAPVIDTIDSRRLALIQKQVAPGCDHAEVGHFLELCAHYQLDPFAREAWCAKGKNGRLLIMVGRDGLRKIGQRNGLHIDGDVVRANDEFTLCRTPDGNRTITHAYNSPKDRGEIVGAWAECRMGGPLGKPMGYFYAPLDEYLPKGVSEHSPWSKQVGVMILAAAERQAIRQATPLGGLLAEGEDEVVNEHHPAIGDGQGDGQPAGLDLGPEVEKVIARAQELGHAALSDRATIEMVLDGQPQLKVKAWVEESHAELDDMPLDAEVVPDAPEGAVSPPVAQTDVPAPEDSDGPETSAADGETGEFAEATPEEQAAADELGMTVISQGFLDDGPPRKAEPRAHRDPDTLL